MTAYKTRFCPSPTGLLHLGNLRTALLNVLLAIKSGGTFILRIEDTDAERSKTEFSEAVCDDLEWMGLDWQEGPRIGGPEDSYYQSERNSIYESFYDKLLEQDLIYPCFTSDEELKIIRRNQMAAGEPPRYTGIWANASKEDIEKELEKGTQPVYRFRLPKDRTIIFQDLVKGEQSFHTSDLDDFIVRKKDLSPTFMFANAIDDSLMGVNVVLRGDDHLSNTPRQIALLEALNLEIPEFIHVALFTGDDGAPLSKRNGSLSVKELKEIGYFPQAVINYLSRVGHIIPDNELRDLEGLSSVFDVANISTSPSRIDHDQLTFWQKNVIESKSIEELSSWLESHLKNLPKDIDQDSFVGLIKDNIVFPNEAVEYLDNLFVNSLSTVKEVEDLIKQSGPDFFKLAEKIVRDNWGDWSKTMKLIGEETGTKGKDLFMPIRASITGQLSGPELDQVTRVMGQERVIKRLKEAAKL
tara:strand:+ start:1739 stop:3145 length:1407 start_codon:yes stop_codon:yes gene_type:complete